MRQNGRREGRRNSGARVLGSARPGGWRGRRSAAGVREAFSLAELMIALMILGLGLLFIASALPAGLDYTRTTVDLSTADAAADYALDTLEANLRLAGDQVMDPRIFAASGSLPAELGLRQSNVFEPRAFSPTGGVADPNRPVDRQFEPFIKVRPVVMGNVNLNGSGSLQAGVEVIDDTELAIQLYLGDLASVFPLWFPGTNPPTMEVDFDPQAGDLFLQQVSLRFNPAVPALARVYPPVEPVSQHRAADFFDDLVNLGTPPTDFSYPAYLPRLGLGSIGQAGAPRQLRERLKAVDRRIGWTAFYRRVSYSSPGIAERPYDAFGGYFPPPGTPESAVLSAATDPEERFGSPADPAAGADDELTDPELYELIVVITRRPSERHRYARQDFELAGPFLAPSAVPPSTGGALGGERLLPMPWLAVFETVPIPQDTGTLLAYDGTNNLRSRELLNPGLIDSGPLEFTCTPEMGRLLPVGSIFIPAANDHYPHVNTVSGSAVAGQLINYPLPRRVGFVPHQPNTVPIYRVIGRPDETTVVVENNGFYPWVVTEDPANGFAFPVWVIPPPYAEVDATGQPIYEDGDHILAVERRIVRLSTVPDVEVGP